MDNLWKTDFKPIGTKPPKEIIMEQCAFLLLKTNNKVIAKIANYKSPIIDYINENENDNNESIFYTSQPKQKKSKNGIQDHLGEINKNNFTYEFYVTSINTSYFKYRIMFIEHGITFYPVYIILDQSISDELEFDSYVIECDSQEMFITILTQIINSEKIKNVIASLLQLADENTPTINVIERNVNGI